MFVSHYDQTLYQIASKSNNPRLSYSDLKIQNLRADPIDFMVYKFQSLRVIDGRI